jgi:hypothetical protein
MNARLILFRCAEWQGEVRQEPASGNGSVQVWCRCGEHSFPAGNLLPKTPDEWAFVVKRVSRGIREAQAKYEERMKRLMVSDIVFKYRNSRPERPSILSQVGDSE